MKRSAPSSRADEIARRFGQEAVTLDSYNGAQLAPLSPDGVSPWDVSAHARREQARIESPGASNPTHASY